MSSFKSMISGFVATLVVAPSAYAKIIYSETLSSSGSKQQSFVRTITAPKTGRYLLVLKNGESEKFSRIHSLSLEVNGESISALKPKSAFDERVLRAVVPVDLVAGTNRVQLQYTGVASSRFNYAFDSGDKAVQEASFEMSAELPIKFVEKKGTGVSNKKLVADEYVLEKTNFSGGIFGSSVHKEQLKLPRAKSAKIRVGNTTQVSQSRDCSVLSLIKSAFCKISNVGRKIESSLSVPGEVSIVLNGKVVGETHSAQNFEREVELDEINSLEVRVKGWVTASSSVEIQALEENFPPMAQATVLDGIKLLPSDDGSRVFSISAAESTDENDQVVSYRFQVRKKGSKSVVVDSDWQAAPVGELPLKSAGKYEVIVSARDKFGAVGRQMMSLDVPENTAPVINSTFYRLLNNSSPYQVRAEVRATDSDVGDTLEYNFAFSNGQTTGYQSSNRATTTFTSSGTKSVTITVRDSAGATTTQTLSMAVGGNLIPIPSMTFASARAGYAPHTINFDASNSTDPDGPTTSLRYFWDFGDGSPSVEGKQVSHTFAAGEWIVSLSVLDSNFGVASQSRAVFSWVDAAPVPMYSYSRVPGSLQINFDGSASAPGNSAIANFRWELGNGTVLNQTSPYLSYTYPAAGVYSTSLRVYDQEGDANIYGQTVTVFNGQKPTANINLVASDTVLPATFVIDATGSVSPNSGGSITGYKWTLPGGETRFTPSITYARTTAGNFNVQLEVMDSFGYISDPVVQTFSATMGVAPIAQIQVDKTTVALGQAIQVSGLTSYTPNANANLSNFEWTLPSGNKLYGPNQTINLSATGLKTISLKVTDSKGYVSSLATVQVNVVTRQNPTAVITPISIGSTTVPSPVHYSGTTSTTPNPGSYITGFEWRITAPTTPPIDATFFGPEFQTTFTIATSWTISLRVFDSAGGTSAWTSTTFGPTTNTIPVAHIASVATDTAPATFVFNGLGSSDPDGHAIVNWHWLFSDGGEAFGPNPTRVYTSPGTYTVMMRVQDEYWAWSDPVSITVNVIANQAPVALIAVGEVPGQKYQRTLDATGSFDLDGTITGYYWWIEGQSGLIGTGPQLTHTFVGGGTFVVHLDVYDNKGLQGTAQSTLTVALDHPTILKARYEVDETDTMKFAFKSSESTDVDGIASYKWLEGTNVLSTTADFVHTFATEGIHNVTLEIRDVDGVLATKSFAVRASASGIAGFLLASREDEGSERIAETLSPYRGNLTISTLPAYTKVIPVLNEPLGDLDVRWFINDIHQGDNVALDTTLIEIAPSSIKMFIRDGESIAAKVSRQVTPLATACGAGDPEPGDSEAHLGLCLSVLNMVEGFPILDQDFSVTMPISEDIQEIGSLVVETIDGQHRFDLTSEASFSAKTVSVASQSILSKIQSIQGPFTVQVEVLGLTSSFSGRIPLLNFATEKLLLPAGIQSFRLALTQVDSGRTVFHRAGDLPSFVNIPRGMFEVLIDDISSGSENEIYHGLIALNTLQPAAKTLVTTPPGPDGVVGKVSVDYLYGASASATSLSQSSLSAMSSNGESDEWFGVVARTRPSWGGYVPPQPSYDSTFDPQSFTLSYSLKSEHIPWTEIGDLVSPINQPQTKTKSLECKVFESNWDLMPEVRALTSHLPSYFQGKRAMARIEDVVQPIWMSMEEDRQWFHENEFCTGMYPPTPPSEFCLRNTDINTVANSEARMRLSRWRSNYYLNQRTWPPLIPQSQAAAAMYGQYNSALALLGMDPDSIYWYGPYKNESHEFSVDISFYRESGVQRVTKQFSSKDLNGTQTPQGRTGDYIPLNPFSVTETKSVLIPFDVPKNTEAVSFRVYRSDRKSGIEFLNRRDHGISNVLYDWYSVACRLADQGYVVQSAQYNPGLESTGVLDLVMLKIGNILRKDESVLDAIGPAGIGASSQLQVLKGYVSSQLFSIKESYLATDLDTFDTSINQNPLWARMVTRPNDASDLNYPLQIKVGHPADSPPLRVDMVVTFGNSSPGFVVQGTKIETATPAKYHALYKIIVPMQTLIASMKVAAFDGANPIDPKMKITLRPIPSDVSETRITPLVYQPRPLFNARIADFKNTLAARRALAYSGHVSPMVGHQMARLVKVLDQIGLQAATPEDTTDFRINDGALPFAGLFPKNIHAGHNDGGKLDMRTFGVLSSNMSYDSVGPKNDSGLFSADGTRYDDIAVLMRAGRVAEAVNEVLTEKLLREDQCYIASPDPNAVNPCLGKLTVEQCLFLTPSPVVGSSCELLQLAFTNQIFPISRVVEANSRLSKWVVRNQSAFLSLSGQLSALGLSNFYIYFADGSHSTAKRALFNKVNRGPSSVGKLVSTSSDTAKLIPDGWHFRALHKGTISLQADVSGPRLHLLDSNGNKISVNSNVEAMFKPETGPGPNHFDHFHLNTN